jgi:dTDP-4-amino-4,6-dideoxygalactose transaminase
MTINEEAMAPCVRGEQDYLYKQEKGKSSPHEILDAIASINAEGRPIWKPMHMQPIYKDNIFVSANESPVNEDIFERGLCLPSDNKMTPEQQDVIIALVRACFE